MAHLSWQHSVAGFSGPSTVSPPIPSPVMLLVAEGDLTAFRADTHFRRMCLAFTRKVFDMGKQNESLESMKG